MAVLDVKNLKKIYRPRFGGNQVQALSCVNFSVEEGEYVAIMGESGSGKTTLLNIMAALDKPTEGTVLLDGKPLSSIKDKDIAQFRRDNLGFVFQEFNLLDTFNVKDNILLPLVLKGENCKHMDSKLQPIAAGGQARMNFKRQRRAFVQSACTPGPPFLRGPRTG